MFCPYIKGDCREDCAFYVIDKCLVRKDAKIYERNRGFCILAEQSMFGLNLSESAKVNHENITIEEKK